ncbi:MAG: hypothetical protein QM783_05580 [Phycisphaerales bacterium]
MRQAILSVCALAAASAAASAQVFQFNSPNFAAGESTPLSNRAPDVAGPLTGVTASFTMPFGDDPLFVAGDNPAARPNGLMDGQYLIAPTTTFLVINFSQPVMSFDFDFALDSRVSGAHLNVFMPLSTSIFVESATDVGGGNGFWGGHMHVPGGAFGTSQIVIYATDANFNRILFSIDNLAIPTPGAAAAIGVAGAASLRRPSRRR